MSESPESNRPGASAELSAALDQARTKAPVSAGVTKATLGLAGALLLIGGFVGGYVTGDATSGGGDRPGGTFARMDGPGNAMQGGRPVNLTIGKITKVDGNTVTIKTTSGSTVKATIGSDTTVNISKTGSVKDLAKGDEIVVNGQRDGDTIAAEFVSKGRAFGPRMERRTGGSGAGG